MKKRYIKPEAEVVILETTEGMMMQMSADGMNDVNGDINSSGGSRPKDNFWGS